jgi:hypothetical protein
MGKDPLFVGYFLKFNICLLFCLLRQLAIVLPVVFRFDKQVLFPQAPVNIHSDMSDVQMLVFELIDLIDISDC